MRSTVAAGRAHAHTRAVGRGAVVALAALLWLVGLAAPAAANGPVASNYRSMVSEAPDGVAAEVRGGDAYVAIAVEPGTEVVVPGYDDEPYLRVAADGTVQRNARSPATYLNEERYGQADGARVPAEADPAAEPEWETVADGGVWAWHDHRIHWMSPEQPPQAQGASEPTRIFDWSVPVEVDGDLRAIHGELTWLPSTPPLAAALVAVGAVALGGWALTREGLPRARVGLGGAALAAAGALALAGGELVDRIPGQGLPTTALPGAVAALGALGLVVAALRRTGTLLPSLVATLGGGVVALVSVPALWQPITPGLWPTAAVRVLLVATLAAAAVGLIALLLADQGSPADHEHHAG